MKARAWTLLAGLLWPAVALGQAGGPTPLAPPGAATAGALQANPAPITATPLPPPSGAPAQGPAAGPAEKQAEAPAQPAQPRWPNVWVPAAVAQLQVLDKIDSVAKELSVNVGQSVTFGALTIGVQACVVRPPTQPADAAAFLVIADSHKGEPGFRGWSLANEPWLSMLQNPIYDVRVVGCAG
ncbi:MAG TPA: DUF2155 domain-containing protein [Acetobacteraceae bacterium]|nr:DUF2155 domain-containing protein [Acetobacteraceae bacterium]